MDPRSTQQLPTTSLASPSSTRRCGEKYFCKFNKYHSNVNLTGEIKQVDSFNILVLVTKDHVAASGSRYYRRHLYKVNRASILELWNSRHTIILRNTRNNQNRINLYINGSSLNHLRIERINTKLVEYLKSERYFTSPLAQQHYNTGSNSYNNFVSAGTTRAQCIDLSSCATTSNISANLDLHRMHNITEPVDIIAQNFSSVYIDATVKPFIKQTVCAFAAKNYKDCLIMLDHKDQSKSNDTDHLRLARLETQLLKLQSLFNSMKTGVDSMHTKVQHDIANLSQYTRNAISLVNVTQNPLARLKKYSPDYEDKCYLNSLLIKLVGKATTKQLYDYAYAQGITLNIDNKPRILTHKDVEYLSYHHNRSFVLIPYLVKTKANVPFKYRFIEWFNQNPLLVNKYESVSKSHSDLPSRSHSDVHSQVFPKRKPKPIVRNYGGLEDSDSD